MAKLEPKKLSRRDAIKILGAAAGATVLANLPSKWSTPELTSGRLPAHAATSLHTLACDSSEFVSPPNNTQFTSGVTVNPPDANIVMRWTITSAINVTPIPFPNTGTAVTNGSGHASLLLPALTIINPSYFLTLVNVQWQFENAADGNLSDHCDQYFEYDYIPPTQPP